MEFRLVLLFLVIPRLTTSHSHRYLQYDYDYIIVGAGAAGCVLANRLSEDPQVKVILLEAGGKDTDSFITVPRTWLSTFTNPKLDWGYTLEPLISSLNRTLPSPSGKVLGGSTSVNAASYTRGSPNDFDRWLQLGNNGWGFEDVLPYFKKSEQMLSQEILKNGFHGDNGPLTTRPSYKTAIMDEFIKAGVENGFDTALDFHDPQHYEGINYPQITVDEMGHRMSSSKAFLDPIRGRHNLVILTEAYVTKIKISKGRAEGVYVSYNGEINLFSASREVIISAGSISSPKILMLSGIGPRDQLIKHQIEIISNLPVGENLKNHPAIPLSFNVDKSTSIPLEKYNTFEDLFQYIFTGTGIWSSPSSMIMALYKSVTQPSVDDFPYIELLFNIPFTALPFTFPELVDSIRNNGSVIPSLVEAFQKSENGAKVIDATVALLHPKASGTVRLRNTNPFDNPVIEYDILGDPNDVDYLIQGIRTIQNMANTNRMRNASISLDSTPHPDCVDHVYNSTEYWHCYIHSTFSNSLVHYTSSCKMAPDKSGVVDHRLRVKGVSGLRVVDASIMPHITSGHTMAPTIMIAEKGADMIMMETLDLGEVYKNREGL